MDLYEKLVCNVVLLYVLVWNGARAGNGMDEEEFAS